MFPDDFEPFFQIIESISSFGEIATNYDFGFGEILFVDEGRNDLLLVFIGEFVAVDDFFAQ